MPGRAGESRAPAWLSRAAWPLTALHPRAQFALKAALAAGVAWQLALLLPSSVDRYAYYAPFGALLAMYPTVSSSFRAGAQTAVGILLGATIAVGIDEVFGANVFTVAVIIGLGVLAGVLPWLGEQRSWVPITALFVFTIGEPGSPAYILGYVLLTLLGVGIGTLVNFAVFPPLHLRRSRQALNALQTIVVDQLQDLADGLEQNEQPDRDAWQERTRAVSPTVTTMHQALDDLTQSTRANPRARWHRTDKARQEEQAHAFQRMALLVEDLVNLLAEVEQEGVPALPFRKDVRLQCADVMRRLADLGRTRADGGDSADAETAACQAMERLEASVSNDPTVGGADPFVAGSVVTTLRRCLGALISCGGPTAIQRNRAQLFR